jgi:hypothetical protein
MTDTVTCGSCGITLSEPPNIGPEERSPCPACGSTRRKFHVHVFESLIPDSAVGTPTITMGAPTITNGRFQTEITQRTTPLEFFLDLCLLPDQAEEVRVGL